MLKDDTNLAKEFTIWLDGFLDSKESLTDKEVNKLKDKISNVFVHEIDPSMPDVTGELQTTHDGFHLKPKKPGSLNWSNTDQTLYKC